MAVYIDKLINRGMKINGKPVRSCHMLADTLTELNKMAKALRLKPEWLHKSKIPHYDLTEYKASLAFQKGAILIDRKELGQLLAKLGEKYKT